MRLTSAEIAQAQCDAELLGRVDGARPVRVTRTIPPAIRRQVFRRDRGRCIVPGCRAARFLEVHHVVPRAHGGDHDPRRLGLVCAGHHHAAHAGLIEITGEAPYFIVRRVPAAASAQRARPDKSGAPDGMTHVGRGAPASWAEPRSGTIAAEAIAGLHQMGFSRGEATRAVHEAMTDARASTNEPTLQAVLLGALRSLRKNSG